MIPILYNISYLLARLKYNRGCVATVVICDIDFNMQFLKYVDTF